MQNEEEWNKEEKEKRVDVKTEKKEVEKKVERKGGIAWERVREDISSGEEGIGASVRVDRRERDAGKG